MSNTEIETRISALEKELSLLKVKFEKIEKQDLPWWKQIIGTFANDPAHAEAMRLGREYRMSQREDYDTEGEE